MIIKQKCDIAGNLNSKLTKLGYRRLEVDIDRIESDIKIVQSMLKGAQRQRKAKLEEIITSMKNLCNNSRFNTIPLLWYCNNGLVYSYPGEFRNFEDEGINFIEYVKKPNNTTFLRIQYKQLINIIAFEMMYQDMGYTHRQMEEHLDSAGIITQNQADLLLNVFSGEEPYELSKVFKVQKSGYYVDEDDIMYDYFQTSRFETNCYARPVEYSCRHALAIILDELLVQLKDNDVAFTLCAIDDKSITFLTDQSDEAIKKFTSIATEPVTVRAFGRQFNTVATVENLQEMEEYS